MGLKKIKELFNKGDIPTTDRMNVRTNDVDGDIFISRDDVIDFLFALRKKGAENISILDMVSFLSHTEGTYKH